MTLADDPAGAYAAHGRASNGELRPGRSIVPWAANSTRTPPPLMGTMTPSWASAPTSTPSPSASRTTRKDR